MGSRKGFVRMRLLSDETFEELQPAKNSRIRTWLNNVEHSVAIDSSCGDQSSVKSLQAPDASVSRGTQDSTVMQLESVSAALERFSSCLDSNSACSGVSPERRGIP